MNRARKFRNLTQGEFASKFELNQTRVSRMEADSLEVPASIRVWIEGAEAEMDDQGDGTLRGTASQLYSYTSATFRRLFEETAKRVKHLDARAEIRPSKDDKLADATLKITFKGMRVPRGDAFYSDCLGVLPKLTRLPHKTGDMLQFKEKEGSKLSLIDVRASRAKVKEVKKVQELIGPHALGYELSNVDEADEISITIKAERGVRADDIDAIGVPVYADCPVESLSLHVTFIGFVPKTRPKAEVYLLRRTLVDSRPLDLAGDLDHNVINESRNSYSFESLLYPKAGYGYCIAWDSLEKAES